MATGTISNSSFISDIGATFVAEARVGGNGEGDTPEYDITDENDDGASGRLCWDSDLSDGFDTNWVPAQLDVEPSGSGITWTLTFGGPQSVTYSGITYGTIWTVFIRAAVQTAAKSAWRQVSVKFYKSGAQTDSYSTRSGPQIDLGGFSLPVEGEQVLTVTPNAGDNDKVVVSGQFRFTSASTSPPDPQDMFAQLFILTSS